MWSVPRSYIEDSWGDHVSSAWEAVKRGPERMKLKNLHCHEPLPGDAWWRHSRLEIGLVGAVVICELWILVVAL
jgi:hypothetical protein